jgi:hypothetical protein
MFKITQGVPLQFRQITQGVPLQIRQMDPKHLQNKTEPFVNVSVQLTISVFSVQ